MHRRLLPTLATITASAVLGLALVAVPAGAQSTSTTSAPASGSSSGSPSSSSTTTSSPDEWASGVCTAVSTWLDSVDGTVEGLGSAASLDQAADQARTGIRSATDTLKTDISDLGRPSTGDGKKAQKQIDALTSELDALSQSIQQLLGNPGSNPIAIAGTLAQVGSDVGKAVNEVQSTATALKGLKPNGALRKAFQTEPSCTQLKKRL